MVNKIRDYVWWRIYVRHVLLTDTINIVLATEGVDIYCRHDGDPMDMDANQKLDYSPTFAFRDFKLVLNLLEYSDIPPSTIPPSSYGDSRKMTISPFLIFLQNGIRCHHALPSATRTIKRFGPDYSVPEDII